MVTDIATKSGKKYLYLGKGNLRIKDSKGETIRRVFNKSHWYWGGDWVYDGKTGELTLKGTSADCLSELKVLRNKRAYLSCVIYFPIFIGFKHNDKLLYDIEIC